MKYTFILFLASLFFGASAQTTFYRSLDYDGEGAWGMQVASPFNGYAVIALENCDGKTCVNWFDIDEQGEIQDQFYLTDTTLSISGTFPGSYLKTDSSHYITATITYPDGNIEGLVSKIDPIAKEITWTKTFGSELEDVPTRLLAGEQQHIFAYYSAMLSESPFISTTNLLKLDPLGNIVWQTAIGIEDDYNNAFNHLHLPNGDHLTFYAACEPGVECQSFLTGYGLYVTRVDTSGAELWSQELRRGDFLYWHGTDPVLLDDGLIALNWIHDTLPLPSGVVRFQDMLIWMDQDGEIVREFFFPKDRERNIRSMTKAANGDIIGAGSVDLSGLDLGRGGYVFRMRPDGTLLWERYLADVRFPVDSHFFNDVIEADDGGIVLTGLLRDSFPNADPVVTNPNVWLVKLDSLGCLEPGCSRFQVMGAVVSTQEVQESSVKLRLFPNPTATFTQLQWPLDAQLQYPLQVQVFDLAGRAVLQRSFRENPVVLQCSGWSPGYYVVQVRDQQGRQWVQKLVVR